MGRGGHQQQVPGEGAHELAQLVAEGLLDLVAEARRRHLVSLVRDDQVPFRVRELGLQVEVAGELVEPADDEVVLAEPVAGAGRLQLVVGQDLEGELELLPQLVLPLLGERAGADHHAAAQVAPDVELLDEEAGHDGLAGAGIVRQEEPQGLARQHLAVDRQDLVRQRHDLGGVDGEEGVEQVRQADAVSLGGQLEEMAVGGEGPGRSGGHDLEARLVAAIEDLVAGSAAAVLERQLDGAGAVPANVEHRHRAVGADPFDERTARQLFEAWHEWSLVLTLAGSRAGGGGRPRRRAAPGTCAQPHRPHLYTSDGGRQGPLSGTINGTVPDLSP